MSILIWEVHLAERLEQRLCNRHNSTYFWLYVSMKKSLHMSIDVAFQCTAVFIYVDYISTSWTRVISGDEPSCQTQLLHRPEMRFVLPISTNTNISLLCLLYHLTPPMPEE